MSLTSGTKLGPYEIIAPLGAGGMGEVYRAHDARLGRDVAIKALPATFAEDPERLSRFQREAKVLASLSHPNIAGIYGLEEVNGSLYLVLEYVEGETLAARLARGPLAGVETAEVCRQVAAGVEAAHEAGIVHRDLKPANILLRLDGVVKVLDFGLAKGSTATDSDPNLSASPTMTHMATKAGVILGTAAYMSPEQARGKAVDRRTDIWSFGCVLYECLTGRIAFGGETVSDVVAQILAREPDFSALPPSTPMAMRALLVRCLTKDMKQRLQAIGEARIALEAEPGAEPFTPMGRSARFSWLPWAVAGALAVLAAAIALKPSPIRNEERRLDVAFPPGLAGVYLTAPVISPDGRRLAVVGADSAGTRAWVRSLDAFEFHPVKGTEGTEFVSWSPDSRSLAFVTRGSLYRVSVDDGTTQKIADGFTTQRGLNWGSNGDILYTPSSNGSIWRIPSSGGLASQVTHLDTTLVDASHRWPVWMPDGKHFLFALWSNSPRVLSEQGGVYLAAMDGSAPRRVTPDVGGFLVLRSGHLLLERSGALVALPFNLRTGQVGAQAVSIADRVKIQPASGFLPASASASDDIAFDESTDPPPADFAWIDRAGLRSGTLGFHGRFETAVLSPDAAQVACGIEDATGLSQIWIADLARHTVQRLTHGQNDSFTPRWSPRGDRIVFANTDSGSDDLYLQLASGTRPPERVLAVHDLDAEPSGWSADGRYVFFTGRRRPGGTRLCVCMLDLERDSVNVLLANDFDQAGGRLSPDGRWLAYVSNESGIDEVCVRSFPDLERRWQVSTSGGTQPHWRRDSGELVYLSGSRGEQGVYSVSFAPGSTNPVGQPQRLFTLPADVLDLDPTADHLRFLALIQPSMPVEPPLRVLLGWKGDRRS